MPTAACQMLRRPADASSTAPTVPLAQAGCDRRVRSKPARSATRSAATAWRSPAAARDRQRRIAEAARLAPREHDADQGEHQPRGARAGEQYRHQQKQNAIASPSRPNALARCSSRNGDKHRQHRPELEVAGTEYAGQTLALRQVRRGCSRSPSAPTHRCSHSSNDDSDGGDTLHPSACASPTPARRRPRTAESARAGDRRPRFAGLTGAIPEINAGSQ